MNQEEKTYWSKFYSQNKAIIKPSDFALFICDYLKTNTNIIKPIKNILDIGCGNGRDSYYFAEQEYNIVGIDASVECEASNNCNFVIGNMITYPKDKYDMIYSRFSIHSIPNKEILELFNSIQNKDTLLCIETRSDKGKLEARHFGDGHYRNFTNLDNLKLMLTESSFKIIYIEENDGFAIYKDENPICIRVICQKI